MGSRGILAASCAFVLAACGITAVGEQPTDLTGPDGGASSSSSSGSSSGNGSTTCDGDLGAPNAVILPAGGACPPGTTEQIVQSDPKPTDGACSCGDCTPTSSLCAGPSFTWHWASNNSCSPSMQSYDVTADNACIPVTAGVNTTLDVYNRWTRSPVAGTCNAPKVVDAQKIATTPVRQCVPNPGSRVCPAGGDRVCVPAGPGGVCSGAFSVAVVVGDGATVDCGACACTRTATACHVEYHNDATCTDLKYQRDADGQCLPTGQPKTYTIKVYPTGATCTKTPGAATASLTNARTLCCNQ